MGGNYAAENFVNFKSRYSYIKNTPLGKDNWHGVGKKKCRNSS